MRAYNPYRVVTTTGGSAQTRYGCTNEYIGDSTQLVYLRARMYAPSIGRFLTKDTWSGDYQNPLTLNAWNYTSGNPINRVDPSGHCYNPDGSWNWFESPWFGLGPCSPNRGGATIALTPTLITILTATATCTPTSTPTATFTPTPILAIVGFPNITISNPQDWSVAEATELTRILRDKVLPAFGNSLATFANAVGNISVMVVPDHSLTDANGNEALARSPFDKINFEHRMFSPADDFGIIHECGHQFDWQGHESDAQKLQWRSQQFVDEPTINTSGCTGDRLKCRSSYTDKDYPGGIFPIEAYANAFAAYILGDLSKFQAKKYSIIQNDIQSVP